MAWRTVLFDFDGTLFDSAPGLMAAWQAAVRSVGLPPLDEDACRALIGPPFAWSLEHTLGLDGPGQAVAAAAFKAHYDACGALESPPYPGIVPLLDRLRDAGLTLMIATSKPEGSALQVLEHWGLRNRFAFIAGSGAGLGDGKEDAVRRCLERAEGPAVLVGDRSHDVWGGHARGIPVIGALWGYGCPQELAEADYLVQNTAAPAALLLNTTEKERFSMKRQIASDLLSIRAVFFRPDEPFIWASGIKSPVYCDNRLILTAPEVRSRVEQAIADTVRREYPEAQVLMGTSTAGIAHAAIAASILNMPMGYVRGSAKDHGRNNQIEGRLEPGQKVVVIEDLISTGGSVIEVVNVLREAGAQVLGVVSIFTYGMQKGLDRLAAAQVKNVSLTDFDTIAEVAAESGYIAPADVQRLLAFRANPSDESWIGK